MISVWKLLRTERTRRLRFCDTIFCHNNRCTLIHICTFNQVWVHLSDLKDVWEVLTPNPRELGGLKLMEWRSLDHKLILHTLLATLKHTHFTTHNTQHTSPYNRLQTERNRLCASQKCQSWMCIHVVQLILLVVQYVLAAVTAITVTASAAFMAA